MIESRAIKSSQLVLITDDQEINRDVLEMMLEDDYDIILAEDGVECLEQIERNIDRLSIVLLDLMMPNMNGFEVLERMHADERMKRIPVIVLTAERTAELRALQLGAADFIVKPFDAHEVIRARVSRIIELSEGRQLISAAERDVLTGLYDRNFFFEYAARLFQHHPETHFDAIVMNVEQFHSVNALNGREFGDEVLRTIGEEVRAFLTETQGIACRFEADRFDIYCQRQPDYEAVLDRFQEALNDKFENVNIHLRMGVRPWAEGVEPVVMFDQARAACNMVRGNYQQPIKFYNDEMLERELKNQRLLNDLRLAIDEKQFQVFYQPKYNVQVNPPQLTSAEALIRWFHPELGMISPGEFIPLFEGNGLIGVVDRYVWAEAAHQVREWRDKYDFTLPVSVNISRTDIFDPGLTNRFEGLLVKNGLVHADLKLEITESSYTNNARGLLTVIDNLRDLGFEIEMDDFGSGYSSLNMLSDMPIDVLKMDMKFVRNIEHNATDRRLVELILDIAKYLDVSVIAEGVETEGQLTLLRDAGCDIVQGYYFSRPLPASEFEELIIKEMGIDRSES